MFRVHIMMYFLKKAVPVVITSRNQKKIVQGATIIYLIWISRQKVLREQSVLSVTVENRGVLVWQRKSLFQSWIPKKYRIRLLSRFWRNNINHRHSLTGRSSRNLSIYQIRTGWQSYFTEISTLYARDAIIRVTLKLKPKKINHHFAGTATIFLLILRT